MPELPEVENVKMSLEKIKLSKILGCELYNKKFIKRPDDAESFINNIIGLTILDINRRGKYLLLTTSNDYTLIVHLGMTGLLINVDSLNKIPEKYRKHLYVKMSLDNGTFLCYCDIRKFGSLRLLNKEQFNDFNPLKNIGPEPFDSDVKLKFFENLDKRKYQEKTIKEVIMDQSVIAGVGNIYASESLYAASINPTRLVISINEEEKVALLNNIQLILKASILAGGSSISDYLNGEGKSGQFQNYLQVYGKKKCKCGHDIKSVVIEGRNTFYCPVCQKME